MGKKHILLLYISISSGHHRASLAIERALEQLSQDVTIYNINSFNYTNPILEKLINKTYLGIIKTRPEVWEYLYDNPKVIKRTRRLRDLIHKYNSGKLKSLIEELSPSAIACTQAFPCGMVADYKKSFNCSVPLVGVLTDYAPHSYWIYDSINYYCVPSEYTARRLCSYGIPQERIRVYGMPIEPIFSLQHDKFKLRKELGLNRDFPTVLIMGGGQGIGPIREIVWRLNKLRLNLQFIVLAGTNKGLYKWLNNRLRHFKKKILILGYINNVDRLMGASDIIITKPGGITSAEALAKNLPMIIINPIPGQEANNARFLLTEGACVRAGDVEDVALLVEELITNPYKLLQMKENISRCAKPNAAVDIAKLLLQLCNG